MHSGMHTQMHTYPDPAQACVSQTSQIMWDLWGAHQGWAVEAPLSWVYASLVYNLNVDFKEYFLKGSIPGTQD